MHVTIRADGSAEIGYGHLFRSSAIAEELLELGHRVNFATTTPDNAAHVTPSTVGITELASRSDVEPFVSQIRDTTNVVLIDSYTADEYYQRRVRNESPLVVVSDDTRYPVCADVLVNGNLYAPSLEYEILGTEPVWCLGPDYLLLRDSISEQAEEEPPWRERPMRAIVTMGGSDPTEITPRAVRAFDGLDLRVDAIIGPGFTEEQERDIRHVAEEVSADVRPVRDPEDLPQRMFQADFAVSTASTTTYELLALGTPIISLPIVDNQEPIAAELRERDAGIVLERAATEAQFRRAIETYVQSTADRRAKREYGQELIDAEGANRISEKILSLAGGGSTT
ncbi:UDP-2,4-diacetamido-2,4,6-trideoxy-beta-L-altropyranose hydrolase [Natrialba sp. INN-245]|uniref:UDP-2,4-diacetamido-2,4, 6-trideoxy-beta-L-altropyranose hydrolase n=1 Tax=Natrialba sp. INN-245 TaxID=2690967 RepID=UPI00130FF0DB|nr:UDP-2,4-diacetamido-2,4,6-trideoxy-beta-L-altropyranose hydrolase [Natrialba sp. INN-245]MWV40051.1 UDP-2,4-diacetamido-2,4,6-trideoxy-beta-L-altropyranose hydrolase [Natrialba sp. INN-245]